MAAYPDSRRLRVLKALTDSLSKITPANGYAMDLTGSVFRGRAYFGESDPLPMLSILEAPIQADPNSSPQEAEAQTETWQLVIQGFLPDDKQNPTDPAHYLMAAVKQVLAGERAKGGRRGGYNILGLGPDTVLDLRVGPGIVRPPDEISSKAYFWLSVYLDILDDLENPFA